MTTPITTKSAAPLATTRAARSAGLLSSGESGFDRGAWVAFLRERLEPRWRPDEFDPDAWLFTGDPDNPATTSTTCLVACCTTVVNCHTLCGGCQRALVASGLARDSFLATYRPPPPRRSRRLTGQACVVTRDGVGCGRRRISNLSGVCNGHGSEWCRYRDGGGTLAFDQWCIQRARPLPPVPGCLVPGCALDGTLEHQLCSPHLRAWRCNQSGRARAKRVPAQRWAQRQQRPHHAHQFSLVTLEPTLRWELLYALQQREGQGHKLDPVAMRALIKALAEVDTLATTPYERVAALLPGNGAVRAYARILTRIIGLAVEQFRGITHTDHDVWDCLALDLATPRAGRRANLSTIDFTPIRQRWLRDAAKEWVRTVRPDSQKLARSLQACTLASQALSQRPGGGDQPGELTFADMTVVFDAFTHATRTDGRRYNSHYRRGQWARLHEILDFGRATGGLAELAATFHRHSTQSIRDDELNEDEVGKAIPETVIAQLDTQLHLLDARHRYGKTWTPTDSAAMFHTAYQLLRDTGRRPGEIVSLAADCLEIDGGEYSLVYDNHKQRRLRRRLPITTGTAAIIRQWQNHRAMLTLPEPNQRWLFPAPYASSGRGHLTTIRLATALRRWVAAIPTLHSDLPGPGGTPLPFDRSLIYPYAFRHSYAQRHADAGIGVEVLKELMDHRDISVTQGYYKVGLARKRDAIKIMSRYVHDRAGNTCAGPGSASGYELRSVAVPFGNCIEPSNVNAGGKQCPIRFQCAGCGFYRPDPSYLPAIEEHINALRADRETALAIDADDFVTRNLTEQADAFTRVAATMRDRLDALPDAERAEVEQASTVLRKLRAGRPHKLLPLTVKERP